jgi:hypothetical protein
MWFNPHSDSTMYGRSPMMLCSQHHLMQEVHNPLEITVQLTPLTTEQKLRMKPVVMPYMLYYWLYSKPCHATSYTALLVFKWWEALTITVSQSPLPVWRGRVLQVADSGSLHTQLQQALNPLSVIKFHRNPGHTTHPEIIPQGRLQLQNHGQCTCQTSPRKSS